MSQMVDILRCMIACACGKTGIKQYWYDAATEYSRVHGALNGLCITPSSFCKFCILNRWSLQPFAPFILTKSFSKLQACGCGGSGTRIQQTFENVLMVYPRFHTGSVNILGFCVTCNYVCWEALLHVPSIVHPSVQPLPQVKKLGEIIVRARGRIIERVED